MWIESENALFVLSFVVQLMGIGGVLAARFNLSRGRWRRAGVLSLICFLMVGVLSLMLMRTCTGSWLAFATTMPLMAVGATLDLKKGSRAVDF